MKKMIAVLALVAGFLGAGFVLASSASAYPELTCSVSVEPQTVVEGESFTATGTAAEVESPGRSAASGISWTVTFNGITKTGTGTTFAPTFTAPEVDTKTTFTLTATSTSAAGTCTRSVDVTVLPANDQVSPPNEGGLPNTGGPNALILLGGFGLLATGTTAVTVARRRAVEMDAAPRQA